MKATRYTYDSSVVKYYFEDWQSRVVLEYLKSRKRTLWDKVVTHKQLIEFWGFKPECHQPDWLGNSFSSYNYKDSIIK